MSEENTAPSKLCLGKSAKDTVDWKLCILCQESTARKGALVQNQKSESYQKLLEAVEERASLQDGTYIGSQEHLKQFNKETFIEKKPMWHRGCYSDATNPISLQQGTAYSMPSLQEAMLRKNVDIKEHYPKWRNLPSQAAQHLSPDLQQNLLNSHTASIVKRVMARLCSQ